MSERTISNPRIHIDHPRDLYGKPEPSRARIVVDLDWIKAGGIGMGAMTEVELYRLAENALQVAGILRRSADR